MSCSLTFTDWLLCFQLRAWLISAINAVANISDRGNDYLINFPAAVSGSGLTSHDNGVLRTRLDSKLYQGNKLEATSSSHGVKTLLTKNRPTWKSEVGQDLAVTVLLRTPVTAFAGRSHSRCETGPGCV